MYKARGDKYLHNFWLSALGYRQMKTALQNRVVSHVLFIGAEQRD